MPITYQHRVPASTLGGLALAAGQEQYEAQRGREDRERAMKLAQMAQQQQMQEQRMAYDAASTQYRTAADYNKFVMGAALDMVGQERDQQNRLALQNNNDQLGAGREEVRWDRAQEVRGQGDTHQAWKSYVDEVRGTLNQAGVDILDTHSAKYRKIMSNQNFNPAQKSAATALLIEEVQNKNLGQSYAKEQQYEPGKSYVSPKGYKFTVLQDGSHQTLGQNFDDLIKPEEMTYSDWESNGKHVAWLDAHRFGPPSRDSDGKQTHSVEGPDGKMATITIEDEQYEAKVAEEKRIEREKEERAATTERQKNRATWVKEYLDQMNVASPIGEMTEPDGETQLSPEGRLEELKDRREKANEAADELFSEPVAAMGGGAAALKRKEWAMGGGAADAATMGEQPSPAASGIPLGGRRMTAGAGPAPANSRQSMKDSMQELMAGLDDPQMKAIMGEGIEVLDAVMGGAPVTPEMKQKLRDARNVMQVQTQQTKRATEQGSSVEHAETGRFRQQALRRQQALNVGKEDPSSGVRGQREAKVPFERTPEQVRAEEDLHRTTSLEEPSPGAPLDPYFFPDTPPEKYPKGQGQVGAMSGSTAPPGVSAETERIRKARGGEPYTLQELEDITKRTPSEPARELTKEEKIKDRIEDPKTAEKTLFTEIWPGRGRKDPEWLVKSEGEEGGLWGKDKNAEEIGKIYDYLDEWDLHYPGETKEKFISKFKESGAKIPGKHDPSGYSPKQEAGAKGEKELVTLRAEYLVRLKTKLMIKEGRSGYESRFDAAKARQEHFERQYRAQRKYDEGNK